MQWSIIDVYSIEGKRLQSFGEKQKIIKFDYGVVKGMLPSTTELTIFDGVLLPDKDYIYYLNHRFGTLVKFSTSGDKVFETNITSLFGKNELAKLTENKKLFLENGYDSFAKDRSIPRYSVFRSAKIAGDNIVILLDQWNYLESKLDSFIEIKVINKNDLKIVSTYHAAVSKDERLLNFSVNMEKELPIFFILFTTEDGYKVYKYTPTQNRKI